MIVSVSLQQNDVEFWPNLRKKRQQFFGHLKLQKTEKWVLEYIHTSQIVQQNEWVERSIISLLARAMHKTSCGVKQSSLFKWLLIQNSLKLFPLIASWPQKPQKLTASKIKFENFGPKILIPHWKTDILVPWYFKKLNFLNT